MTNPEPERTLLDIAKAIQHPDLEVVRDLLARTTNINMTQGDNGFTALHWAAINGHTELARLLIAHGIDVNARTCQGKIAAEFAGSANISTNNPYREPSGADHDATYYLLLSSGSAYHKDAEISTPHITAFRERWFSEASDAWHRWSEKHNSDVSLLTPKMLLQFESHGTAEKALNPDLWYGRESELRALLTNPEIPPCHISRWIGNVIGLAELVNSPRATIQSWSTSHTPPPRSDIQR